MNARTLALALSAALLAVPSLATADQMSTAPATVIAPRQGSSWLSTAGPDAAGRYSVRVSIADLNPATAQGWAAMQRRAQRAALALCDATADGADMKGFYNAGERQCQQASTAAALGQMSAARAADAAGQPVAIIGISARVASR